MRSTAAQALGAGAARPTAELASRLRFASARLVRQLRRQDEGGLTATLTAALATIVRQGPLTLGALASAEGLSKPSITKVVDQLVAQGLVSRRVDPGDRRVCRVAATAKGTRQLEANRRRRTAWLATRLDALGADDRARVEAAIPVLEALAEDAP